MSREAIAGGPLSRADRPEVAESGGCCAATVSVASMTLWLEVVAYFPERWFVQPADAVRTAAITHKPSYDLVPTGGVWSTISKPLILNGPSLWPMPVVEPRKSSTR